MPSRRPKRQSLAESLVSVLYRDADLLVLDKPTGIATTSPTGRDCLMELAHRLDPDAERLHPSSRLDAPVTGVVVIARSARAIRHLLEARRTERYHRLYVALSTHAPSPPTGEWHSAIGIDPQRPQLRIVTEGGRQASTSYRAYAQTPLGCLLELKPHTGRTHQLRVHAAHAGVPLLGDTDYGGARRVVLADGQVLSAARVMLHCAAVTIPRLSAEPSRGFTAEPSLGFAAAASRPGAAAGGNLPQRLDEHATSEAHQEEPWCFASAIPADLRDLWLRLGGGVTALDGLELGEQSGKFAAQAAHNRLFDST